MREFGFPAKLVRMVKMTLKNTCNKVKIQGRVSDSFETVAGLRQGDPLSTQLFNICLEKVIRTIKTNPGGHIFTRTCQILAYADDLVALGRSMKYLTEPVEEIITAAKKVGLEINNTKSKYVLNKTSGTNEPGVAEIPGREFERVESFKYLGSFITSCNDILTEIKERIAAGNKCYYVTLEVLTVVSMKISVFWIMNFSIGNKFMAWII